MTLVLYGLILYKIDAGAIATRLASTKPIYVAAGVLVYAMGQAISAWKWSLLLKPVALSAPYARMLGFYFIGMFFNIFLPTIVGGDAVKAILLARHTGAPARATVSVFMERNLGLLALLTIATVAAFNAPPLALLGSSIQALTLLLFAAYVAANLMLAYRTVYLLVDRIIARTPLSGIRARASSLYEAVLPYSRALPTLLAGVFLSFAFQALVIVVVFLNAHALGQSFPLAALAVFVPLISLAGMIPVSVNGLGVRDALYLLLFGQIGASPDVSVSLALLYFAVTVLASLPGGLLYALHKGPPGSLPAAVELRSS